MDNIKRHIKITRLIYKQRISSLSLRELDKVNKWLSEDINNKELYDRIFNSDIDVVACKYESIDERSQWNSFNKKVKKHTVLKHFKQYLSIAASIIILFCISVLVYQNRHQATEYTMYSEVQKKSIQLTLSDGSILDLEKLGNKTIVNDDNHSITNVGKKIVYQGKLSKKDDLASIKMNKLVIPKGFYYNVVLSDGTKVWLNSQTKFSYPVSFTGKTREVTLDGEGYFEVFKDKNRPFIVKTSSLNVKVLGTVFNVNTYKDNGQVSTALLSGSVEISSNKEKRLLKPGEVAKYSSKEIKIEKTDILPYIAWKEGMFCFRNESLKNILKCLERSYDVEFVYTKDFEDEYFTGDISRNKPIEAVLSVIDMLTVVNFEKRGNKVFIN